MGTGSVPHKTRRVLIADDHARVRQSLAAMLKACPDLELVGLASDGIEALSLCRQYRPDVILLDFVMPGMDGLAVARMISASYPDIEIILMTRSNMPPGLPQAAYEVGAADIINKTLNAEQLIDILRAENRLVSAS